MTPRGVAYTLRSVLRGLIMSSLAHFTVYSILPRGCFSVCLFQMAVVGQITEQADASTHVFLYVGIKVENHLTYGCLSEQKEIEDNEEKLTIPY